MIEKHEESKKKIAKHKRMCGGGGSTLMIDNRE